MKDKRPDPKPRKYPHLWQAYLLWNELMQMKKCHTLRISSIEKGKSNLDAEYERLLMKATNIDALTCYAKKEMVAHGETVGPIWDWLIEIKGIGEHTAAKLIALFDTGQGVAGFATISKFWRFAGFAVSDGRAERNKKGEKSKFNRRLKSECWLVGDNFIKQQTPGYVEIYYEEKARLRRLHPESEPTNGESPWPEKWTDMHIHRMARRKMVKIFLSHFWVKWREFEGLSVSEPYVKAILGHTNIVEP